MAEADKIVKLTTPKAVEPFATSLTNILQRLVNDDPSTSSIGFLAPLKDEDARDYWHGVQANLGNPKERLHLWVIPDSQAGRDGQVLATVQLHGSPKATHQHRWEVAKLMVHPDAQRRGLASVLMAHIEKYARTTLNAELLSLDTARETPANEFYRRLGWTEMGILPKYAAYADGRLGDVTFFYKLLNEQAA